MARKKTSASTTGPDDASKITPAPKRHWSGAKGEVEPVSVGRPSKLDDETAALIIQHIENGCYFKDAVGAAGVSYTTFRRWMNRGTSEAEEDEVYRLFRSRVKKAERYAIADAVSCIRKAMRTQWTAAAWYLERKLPEIWAAIEKRPGAKTDSTSYAAAPAPDPDAPDVEPLRVVPQDDRDKASAG